MGQGQYDSASVSEGDSDHARSVPEGCDRVAPVSFARPDYGRVVDLHEWISTDLAAMRTRLFDGVLRLVPADRWHESVDGGGATLSGLVLHLARHHDLAVNTVIRGTEPLFAHQAINLELASSGPAIGISETEDRDATAAISPDALVQYATTVFDRTAAWLPTIDRDAFDLLPNAALRLTQHAGLTESELPWLFSMWADKKVWWMLQWPVLGHGHTHTGEATSLRNRMGLSPF